jgi:hypothetical protein
MIVHRFLSKYPLSSVDNLINEGKTEVHSTMKIKFAYNRDKALQVVLWFLSNTKEKLTN